MDCAMSETYQSKTSHLESWRVASALNNMGVTLLERRALRQAHQTLKDAVLVMRNASGPQPTEGNITEATMRDAAAKLQRASQRVAKPSSDNSALPDLLPMLDDLDDRCPAAFEHRPIRIEPHEFDEINLNYLSSVICYNFSLTYVYQSMCVKSARKAATLRSKAFDVLRLADKIIKLKRHQCVENLAVSIHIMSVMVRVLFELGKRKAAKACAYKLSYLQTIQTELDYCDCQVGVQTRPSTAAAA